MTDALTNAHHWWAGGLTALVVALTVVLHYEVLSSLNRRLPSWKRVPARLRVLALIFVLLGLHLLEIVVFGVGIHLVAFFPALGEVSGGAGLLDSVYLSATTYSTLGYGDLVPRGPIRILVGMESLVGLLMITWSASFTYLEMQQYWRPDRDEFR